MTAWPAANERAVSRTAPSMTEAVLFSPSVMSVSSRSEFAAGHSCLSVVGILEIEFKKILFCSRCSRRVFFALRRTLPRYNNMPVDSQTAPITAPRSATTGLKTSTLRPRDNSRQRTGHPARRGCFVRLQG